MQQYKVLLGSTGASFVIRSTAGASFVIHSASSTGTCSVQAL